MNDAVLEAKGLVKSYPQAEGEVLVLRGVTLTVAGGERVGRVTSGTQTPFLKKAIGMAYVPVALTAPGTDIDIEVRGRLARAAVVPMPFYKRPRG